MQTGSSPHVPVSDEQKKLSHSSSSLHVMPLGLGSAHLPVGKLPWMSQNARASAQWSCAAQLSPSARPPLHVPPSQKYSAEQLSAAPPVHASPPTATSTH